MIREIADGNRRDAPGNTQNADEVAEILIIELQVAHHRGKQRRQDHAVEPDEPETECQQQYGFPLVGGIPVLWCGHVLSPVLLLVWVRVWVSNFGSGDRTGLERRDGQPLFASRIMRHAAGLVEN